MPATLKKQQSKLSDSNFQLEILSDEAVTGVPDFNQTLISHQQNPISADAPEILQINLGKMCNQTCKHCHVDAGPDRKEIMSRVTMEEILSKIPGSPVTTIDLTGGAPELNPNFKWFVEELKEYKKHVIVRCNLTIILSNKKYRYLPSFFKEHQIEVIASLPYYASRRTDAQRGEGVFAKSIEALQLLNEVGYGNESGLPLNLVYNPTGAFLPGNQVELENEFKARLLEDYNVVFNNLYTITNLPISRFLDYLYSSGNIKSYMEKLVNTFNPDTTDKLMCRNTLSVGWDGHLYDCDFNQMLDLKIRHKTSHIRELNWNEISDRKIITSRHCYGCTAGAGASCGGALT